MIIDQVQLWSRILLYPSSIEFVVPFESTICCTLWATYLLYPKSIVPFESWYPKSNFFLVVPYFVVPLEYGPDDSEPDHQQEDIGNDSYQFYLHTFHFSDTSCACSCKPLPSRTRHRPCHVFQIKIPQKSCCNKKGRVKKKCMTS